MVDSGLRFTKGHGTGNDFVIVPDPDGDLDLAPALVRAICDRRTGIGADGVLRVVLTAAVPEVAHLSDSARWFMDYRNADGSEAEMCGNGIRVYARFLVDVGYAPPGRLDVATRGGLKTVHVGAEGDVTVDMGVATVGVSGAATVHVDGRAHAATPVSMGNPHVVVPVRSLADAGALVQAPSVEPVAQFPDGVNVEFAVAPQAGEPRRIAMRVHERGVGETRSCGTGACAVVAAVARDQGDDVVTSYEVQVPGGLLEVRRVRSGSLLLTGPAELVATGVVAGSWLAQALPTRPVSAGA